jgi:hypothetical protein
MNVLCPNHVARVRVTSKISTTSHQVNYHTVMVRTKLLTIVIKLGVVLLLLRRSNDMAY